MGSNSLVLDLRNNKIDGKYSGLRQNELAKILRALTGLDVWAAECITNGIGYGRFMITTPGGRGGITDECLLVGPFRRFIKENEHGIFIIIKMYI